jgi:hypothetical protein
MNHERENICDKTMNEITIQTKKRKLKNMKSYKYLTLICFQLLFSCSKSSDALFSLLEADETGINFNNFVEEDAENNVLNYGYFYNGGGVAAGDFNNDGFVDLYFTGNMVADKIYLNKGEKGNNAPKFEDITKISGIKHSGWKTGVTLVDINNDGWLDIYVCRSGAEDPNLRKNLLYINNGLKGTDKSKLSFSEKASEYGLDDDSYSTQASFFDYDKDGDLDCFLVNHSIQQYAGFSATIAQFRQQTDMRYGSKLLKNENNIFRDVSAEAGIVNNVLSFGLGINVSDFNQDGWLDVYISNDYNENDYLYINQKNGSFKEDIKGYIGHTSLFSMGTDAADVNNDGLIDIITLDMLPEKNERIKLTSGDDNYDKYQMLIKAGFHHQSMRNMLQINNGTGFSEIGQLAGISNTDWSWAALFADFDHDGLKDLFVSNGYARDYTNMEFLKFSTDKQIASREGKEMPTQIEIIKAMPPINEPNFIFKNKNGLQFTKKTKEWGFDKKSQSNGAVYADLDNDGDLDIVTNNINEKAFLYLNNSQSNTDFGYLKVQLQAENEGQKIGAKVVVWQNGKVQYQEFQPTRGFQSAMYVPLIFGLEKKAVVDSIEVFWNNNTKTVVKNVKSNTSVTVKKLESSKKISQFLPIENHIFKETQSISFLHSQPFSNDFKIQPLLPEMRSFTGPCLAKGDVNGDKKEDVFIGGGKGQSAAIYLQNTNGFSKSKQLEIEKDAEFSDAKAHFFDVDGDLDLDLVVGSNGYQLSPESPYLAVRLYINDKGIFRKSTNFSTQLINMGAIATEDYDRDGDIDIFVGGGSVSGRFPESQNSVLLDNDGKGNFKENTSFKHKSLVADALFSDINGDNYPDLLVVNEWGSPSIYMNKRNHLNPESPFNFSFLAHCISSADLDNDGDTDYIIGNEGLNTQFNVVSNNNLKMYFGDFSGVGTTVPLVTLFENEQEYPYASRDELLDQIPSLKKSFLDYTSYSKATISDILSSEMLKKSQTLHVNELRSGILWNEKGKLSFSALPLEAQFSPIYAIAVKDVNKDGRIDIILGGNTTPIRVRMGKIDSNYGQVFINAGNRKFQFIPQQETGLLIKGDVKSLNFINQWLLVGINGQNLKTYQLR